MEGIEEMVCEPLPESRQAAIDEVNLGLADLRRAVQFNSGNTQAYYHLGKGHCLLGEPDQAVANYLKYTELRPGNPLGYIGLGFAHEVLGEEKNTKAAWIEAGLETHQFNSVGDELYKAEKYDQAIVWYERALLVNPSQVESLINLGDTYFDMGNINRALDNYLDAWMNDPEMSIQPLIRAYQEKGNFIAVEEYLEIMLEQFPDSSDRLYWYKQLGDSFRGHGEYDQAIELFLEAINEFPDKPQLHLTLGWIYFDQAENYYLAKKEFEKTIKLDGSIAESYFGLARSYFRDANYQEADQYFEEAIIRSPDNRWYYLERGNNARSAGDLNRAIEIYNQVLEKYPDFAYGYYQLAQAYLMAGRLDESIEFIELAINYSEYPADQFFARAGNIYRAAGDYDMAFKAYQYALSINPDNEIAVHGLKSIDEE